MGQVMLEAAARGHSHHPARHLLPTAGLTDDAVLNETQQRFSDGDASVGSAGRRFG
jgi:hypothetical protein